MFLLQKDCAAVVYKTHNPKQLFVGCFPDAAKSRDLREFFSKFGSVTDAKFLFNKSGEAVPFGFLCMIENESTESVLERIKTELKEMQVNIGPYVNRTRKDSNGMLGL